MTGVASLLAIAEAWEGAEKGKDCGARRFAGLAGVEEMAVGRVGRLRVRCGSGGGRHQHKATEGTEETKERP